MGTPAGSIDVFTKNEVIEVKYYKNWKNGIGQVMAYGEYYPLHKKRLHLFAHKGEKGSKYFEMATKLGTKNGIRVTFEEVLPGTNNMEADVVDGNDVFGISMTAVDCSTGGTKQRVVLRTKVQGKQNMLREMHPRFVKVAKEVWSDEATYPATRLTVVDGKSCNGLAYQLRRCRHNPTALMADCVKEKLMSAEPTFCGKFYELFGKTITPLKYVWGLDRTCWPEWR